MKKTFLVMGLVCLLISLPFSAMAEVSGAFVSQFLSTDPRAVAGGTDPVFLIVVQNGSQVLATVNADYAPEGSDLHAKVWSYLLVTLDSTMSGTAALNDSFNVCDVTIRFANQNDQWIAETVSSQNKSGVSNPLAIDCLDLYPLITREFTRIF
ncbi:MAG: hypothetical protein V1782_13695 [Pseudomonadota bacterium]